MFFMTMARTFRIGDRAAVRINGAPAMLTWRDEHTLVIDDHDVRRIFARRLGIDGAGRPVHYFECGDAAANTNDVSH